MSNSKYLSSQSSQSSEITSIGKHAQERLFRIQKFIEADSVNPNSRNLARRLREYIEYLKGWFPHYDFDLWDKVENQFNFIWPQLSKSIYLGIEYNLYEEVRDVFFEIRNLLQWTGRVKERIYFSAWLRKEAFKRNEIGTIYIAISSLAWSYTSSGCHQNLEKANALWQNLKLFLSNIGRSGKLHYLEGELIKSLGQDLYAESMMDMHENGVRIAIRRRQIDDAIYYIEQGRNKIISLFTEDFISCRLKERFMIAFQYHEGITYYLRHDYVNAKVFFDRILCRASLIGWDRVTKGARSWLATLAMELNEYDRCEEILTDIIENYSDFSNKRDIFCLLIKAQLSGRKGQQDEKIQSEKRAIGVFQNIFQNSNEENIICNLDAFALLS